ELSPPPLPAVPVAGLPAERWRAGVLPPGAHRAAGPAVPDLEVPHHAGRRRGRGAGVGLGGRRAGDPSRAAAPLPPSRRAPAVLPCTAPGDEPDRPAAGTARVRPPARPGDPVLRPPPPGPAGGDRLGRGPLRLQ